MKEGSEQGAVALSAIGIDKDSKQKEIYRALEELQKMARSKEGTLSEGKAAISEKNQLISEFKDHLHTISSEMASPAAMANSTRDIDIEYYKV